MTKQRRPPIHTDCPLNRLITIGKSSLLIAVCLLMAPHGRNTESVLCMLSLLVFVVLFNDVFDLLCLKTNVCHENILRVLAHAKMALKHRNCFENAFIYVFCLETRKEILKA